MNSLAPQDATRYWLSHRTVNDLFLLYCFTDAGQSFEQLRDEVCKRAASIPDLCVRLREHRFAYPEWVPCAISAEQITEPVLAAPRWPNVVAALEDLLSRGVRADEHPWRLHLFRGIRDAPGGVSPALVAVLQLSHALADGRRSAEIARALWSDVAHREVLGSSARMAAVRNFAASLRPVEAVALLGMPVAMARTVIRGLDAERARRRLEELTDRGEIPPPAVEFPLTRINHPPAPNSHAIRMMVREDLRVPGYTVTVVAATATARALSRYLAEHDEPNVPLGAQVSMALPVSSRRPRNNYVDLAVELPVDEPDPHRRATRIAADLAARRSRALHPLMTARNRVTEVIPAPVLRRDIAGYPLDLTPETLTGHTVISSVNRGPADLLFGNGLVRWTAGFPALGTVMHLTHGIHGLGNTVTVSIHADPDVIPDIDAYAELVDAALTETTAALRS
ncbi:WS/DGAT domain-containing protein [Nocardia vaccinii]|uniref:WS/DGAT domain-containing protein n=1 Tax=Nocardia vaccinii TaxID=1822 RepID=UPI00082D020E|nr:WS/DGAT domain-containing protein [Nocardia vaccinii]